MNFYLILKWLHVVAVISWMAGLLYLYRLFVYHLSHGSKTSSIHDLLSLMEWRLYRYITIPAAIVALLTGVGIIGLQPLLLESHWFQVKLLSVVGMLGMTWHGGWMVQQYQKRNFNRYSNVQLRILNELPTLLLLIITFMVIVRPVF